MLFALALTNYRFQSNAQGSFLVSESSKADHVMLASQNKKQEKKKETKPDQTKASTFYTTFFFEIDAQ